MTGEPIRDEAALAMALEELVRRDPRLAPHAGRAAPLPLRKAEPGFAALARIIIAQQVSARVADVLSLRLAGLVNPLTPEAYLAAGPDSWAAAGLSRPKQKALAAVAQAVCEGRLDLHALCHRPAEEAVAEMTVLWGVGRWTAEVYLLFAAGHPDVFPARDLALQAAVQDCFGLQARPAEAELIALAETWAPLRSVAARLFWAVYGLDRGLPPPLPAGEA